MAKLSYSGRALADLEGLALALAARTIQRRHSLCGNNIFVMLHSFIKKSERTPTRERDVAVTRMKEVKRENT